MEVDETYVGGKEKNKHACKRQKHTQGRSVKTKTPVIGLAQRGGEIRATVADDTQMLTIEKHIVDNVNIGTQLYTDEYAGYSHIGTLYPYLLFNVIKTGVPTVVLIDGEGYRPAALEWLKSQVTNTNALRGAWNMMEFQKQVNDGFFG